MLVSDPADEPALAEVAPLAPSPTSAAARDLPGPGGAGEVGDEQAVGDRPDELDLAPDGFCRDIHPRLVGSLRLYLGDIETARELAQDALVRVVERWPQVRAMDHPEAWTYRVAFNLARSRLRRGLAEARARRRNGTTPTESWGVDVAEVLAVRAAVAALPARQRQAVVLRFYSDLTVDQIGEAMGCRPGTVKAHLHQGLAALRAAGLRGAEDADGAPGGAGLETSANDTEPGSTGPTTTGDRR